MQQEVAKVGDVSGSYIRLVIDMAVQLGLRREDVLAAQRLEEQTLQDPNHRFDLIQLMRLGAWVIQRTGVVDLGLRLGEATTIMRLGFPGLAAMSSATLGDALKTLNDYEPLTSRCYRGRSQLIAHADGANMQFYSIAPYNRYTIFVVDMVLNGWAELIQWLTGQGDLVQAVDLEFDPPDHHDHYAHYLGCPIHFNQNQNALKLKPGALDTPILYGDAIMHRNLLAQCDQQLAQISKRQTFGDRVRQVLGPMLHGRTPTIEETADKLGMPTWTLRRKLKDENQSFQSLMDTMRKELALSYIRDTELTFGEIAYILGFSTPGAFQRAFKRWTDSTPGAYRRALESRTTP